MNQDRDLCSGRDPRIYCRKHMIHQHLESVSTQKDFECGKYNETDYILIMIRFGNALIQIKTKL